MQGFINTTAGLRPLLIEGIEAVNYQLYSTPTAQHGILSIKYIANQGIGGGNIYIYVPYYESDTQYAIEQFWNWVSDVANGAVGKTYNSYLNNQPFVGIQYATQASSYSQAFAYVAKMADDATIDDVCNHAFETADISGTINTFTNVVTSNAMNANPNVGDRVYIATDQGYTASDPMDPFQKTTIANFTPSPDNPVLLDGIYSYLTGTPSHLEKGATVAQSGNVWRVQIQGGIVVSAEACPIDFTQFGGVSEIDGFLYIINNSFPGFNPVDVCFDTAPTPPTTPTNSGQWIQVKLGFLLFPNSAPQQFTGYEICNYISSGAGGFGGAVFSNMHLPQGAEVFVKDDVTGLYKRFANGNSWQINNTNVGPAPVVPVTYQYSEFYNGVIAVPPEAYFGISANEYAFEYNWCPGGLGSDPCYEGQVPTYPTPLTCTYFERQDIGEPGNPFYITAATILDGDYEAGNGTMTQGWWPCGAGAS